MLEEGVGGRLRNRDSKNKVQEHKIALSKSFIVKKKKGNVSWREGEENKNVNII